MAVISIATEWASDIKQGYCSAGWWLNQKFCCGEMTDSGAGGAVVPPAAIIAAAAAKSTSTGPTSSDAINTAAGPMMTVAARLGARTLPYMRSAVQQLYARAGEVGSAPTTNGGADMCEDWVPWSSWTFPAWIIYILFAIAFASLCAHLVRVFAPYAAGSGISEIKCILAGFVINGFLGAWTFALKSLTLVGGLIAHTGGLLTDVAPLSTAACHFVWPECRKGRPGGAHCLLHRQHCRSPLPQLRAESGAHAGAVDGGKCGRCRCCLWLAHWRRAVFPGGEWVLRREGRAALIDAN